MLCWRFGKGLGNNINTLSFDKDCPWGRLPIMSLSTVKPLLRYLRIGWTLFFGILCLLIIGLWVRSYWWNDVVFNNHTTTKFGSNYGVAYFVRLTHPILVTGGTGLGLNDPYGPQANAPPRDGWRLGGRKASVASRRFEWKISSVTQKVMFPYWSPILFFATLAATPWIHWRFSLRTLLIFTTLVAVVLGVIVWATRK